MNETHVPPMDDRAPKRRDYLLAIVTNNVQALAGTAITLIFGVVTSILFVCSACLIQCSVIFPWSSSHTGDWQIHIATILSGGITFMGAWMLHNSNENAEAIRYVPPVREQVAALPADDILLRGSRPPSVADNELLRAAHESTQYGSKELLRATEGKRS